jgi:hypothetical protein
VKEKIMSLPPSVEPYFRSWIGIDTWHTNNPTDLERFYKFVWAVHRHCRPRKGAKKSKRRPPSDGEIYSAIIEARRGTFDEQALENESQHFSSLYNHLLDFANTPNRPDHIVEKRNILSYYFQLEFELGGYGADPEDIARDMKRVWGENWKVHLEKAKRRLG